MALSESAAAAQPALGEDTTNLPHGQVYGSSMLPGEQVFPYLPGRSGVRKLQRVHPLLQDDNAVFDETPHLYYVRHTAHSLHSPPVPPYRAVRPEVVVDVLDPSSTAAHEVDRRTAAAARTSQWFAVPEGDSVTGLIGSFMGSFDAAQSLRGMKRKKEWPYARYAVYDAVTRKPVRAMTDDEIRTAWERNGEDKRNRGSYTHLQLEKAGNSEEDTDRDLDEWPGCQDVLDYVRQDRGWEIYRTELVVEDRTHLFTAGSVDLVARDPTDGKFILGDYKRCTKVDRDAVYGPRGKERHRRCRAPFADLDDCKLTKYMLQLNVYAAILSTHYGMPVKEMFLACVHPDFVRPPRPGGEALTEAPPGGAGALPAGRRFLYIPIPSRPDLVQRLLVHRQLRVLGPDALPLRGAVQLLARPEPDLAVARLGAQGAAATTIPPALFTLAGGADGLLLFRADRDDSASRLSGGRGPWTVEGPTAARETLSRWMALAHHGIPPYSTWLPVLQVLCANREDSAVRDSLPSPTAATDGLITTNDPYAEDASSILEALNRPVTPPDRKKARK